MIPVVLVSLTPPVLVALVAIAAFYLYRTRGSDKPRPTRPHWTKRPPELYRALDRPCERLGARGEDGGEAAMCPGSQEERARAEAPSARGHRAEPLPIRLEALVGKGRFAEVWRGVKDGATVAVKVFPSVEFSSWRNECSVFSDPKLEHDNVVRFLAAEQRGPPGHALTKYWLVLDYHSLGNLQDFLSANTLSWEELTAMAGSVAAGVAHLHSDSTPGGATKVKQNPGPMALPCWC